MRSDYEGASNSNGQNRKGFAKSKGRKAAWLMLAAAPVAMAVSSQAVSAGVDTWTGASGPEWATASGNFTGANTTPVTGDILNFTTAGNGQLLSDDNLSPSVILGGISFNTGAGAYNLTSNLGANNQILNLTGPLNDVALGATQTVNFSINSSGGLLLGGGTVGGASLALNANQTFASFTDGSISATATTSDVLLIASGSNVTINGAATIGVQSSTTVSNSSFGSYTGTSGVQGSGGTLTINGTLTIGGANTNNTSTKDNTTADFSAYSGLTVNSAAGSLNIGYGQNVKGILLLPSGASSTNFVNVAAVDIGTSSLGPVSSSPTYNSQPGSTLTLGTGTNTIQASTINLGSGKSNGVINFPSSSGSISITGTGGVGTAAISIANENISGTATATPSGLLLAGHNATVMAGAVAIGTGGSTGTTPVAQVTFDTGIFNASSITVGAATNTAGIIGSFTLGTTAVSTGVLNDSGVFVLGKDTSSGTSTPSFIMNGGTANLANGISVTSTSGTTNATVNISSGTVNVSGFGIGNSISSGTLNMTVNLPATGQTATILNLGGTGIYATAGNASDSGQGGITLNGGGTVILAGANTNYSGSTVVNSGNTLQIGSVALGSSFSTGTSSFTNNGVVNIVGTQPISINGSISGSGIFNLNTTNTTTFSGGDSYNGLTAINSGVLAVTGSLSGPVNISGGTLSGTGSVGAVTLSTGAIRPGMNAVDNNFGTLSVSSLTDNTGDMRFDLGGSTSDVISDSGSASFNGSASTISLALDGVPTSSSYTILTAGSGITGTPTLSTTAIGRTTFTLTNTLTSLVVTVSGGPANLIWGKIGGTGDGVTWDGSQLNQNWNNSGHADTFYADDKVTFSDANNGHNAVTLVGQLTPASVTFSNNTQNYTLSGPGGIAGLTGLTVSGNGAVTLLTSNTYSGDTNINSGTLILGTGGSIADTNVNINGGTLNLSGGALASTNLNINSGVANITATASMPTLNVLDNTTLNIIGATATVGTLTGSGVVNLNGGFLNFASNGSTSITLQNGATPGGLNVSAGTLVYTGSATYTGATTIAAGATLQIGDGSGNGSISSTTAISDSGVLAYNVPGGTTIANTITGTGTVRFLSGGTNTLNAAMPGFTGAFNVAGGSLVFNYAPATVPASIVTTAATTIPNLGKLILAGNETLTSSVLTLNLTSIPGTLSDGVAADVELTGSAAQTGTAGIVLTGTGIVALSGSGDDSGLGVVVNSGTTLLLNKNSSSAAHAIGGGGLNISSGGIAQITGTGGDQIFNTSGVVTVADGGLFDLNGKSEQVFSLTLGSSANTLGGTLANNLNGSSSVISIGSSTTTGVFQLKGLANLYAASNATLEVQGNGPGPNAGATTFLNTTGPGTVLLTGLTDNVNMAANVTSGTLVLAKTNSSNGAHAVNAIFGVNLGATLRLGGTGGDQIYDGYNLGTTADWGVLNMNGTFDLAGMSEGIDKLTGTGNVINSQSSTSTLTLGTNNLIGPSMPIFNGSVTGNVALTLNVSNGTTTPFILAGPNSYTGGTNISHGILQVGNAGTAGSLGSGPIVLLGTLNFDRTDTALLVPGAISGTGTINQIGAGSTTVSGTNSYTGATSVNAGSLILNSASALPLANASAGFNGTILTIASGASVVALHLTTPTALQVSSLTDNGLIDLHNNALDVNVSSASLPTIVALVQSGYSSGRWNGSTGITSSDAAASANHLTALGTIINDASGSGANGSPMYGSGGSLGSTFEGTTPQDGDVLVKYTYYGDTNLDGKVDGTDYSRIDAGFLSKGALTGWYNGDFNYDGVINGSDYTLIDNAFNSQSVVLASEIATPTSQIAGGGGTSAVPEPASLGLLGFGSLALLGRRRRTRQPAGETT